MNTTMNPSRRRFVVGSAAAGGGLAFGFALPSGEVFGQVERVADLSKPEINAWVVVNPDDSVVIRIARSEMGQGTLTGLAQMVAEELECDWSKVSTEQPTPGQNLARKRVWRDMSTGGSRGIRGSHDYVRQGGAAAREMLIAAAAREWNVPPGECRAANSVITHTPSGRNTTFGEVAAAAAKIEPPKEVKLKDPKDWKLIGKGVARLDTKEKVNGSRVYGADLKLPGMLNAAIKACPVFGGKVVSFDESKVRGMPGVRHVLKVGENSVVVVADTWWRAKKALDALPINWDLGPNVNVSSATIAERNKVGLDATESVFVGNKVGDSGAAIAGAARRVEAVYSYPFQNHATMEPMNATAVWTAEKCEVWCPTQNGEAALSAASAAAGLPLEKCDVYKINLGGGFGRRGRSDYVTQVVSIAKQLPGTPIKLIWSREEDMLHGTFHPVTQCKMTAGLDAQGNITGLNMRISGQSILAGVLPALLINGADMLTFQGLLPVGHERFGDHAISYAFDNLTIDHAMRNTHVPPGFWRGVNANQNAIYMECFIDELAHATNQDALALRQKLMAKNPKGWATLKAVAEQGGWGKPLPAGRGRGLAAFYCFGAYIAACAEVSVSKAGKLKVERIVASTDSGYAVNPKQIAHQVEGSFVYGLGAMLHQECTVKGGRIEQENFNTYQCLRISEMPKVETIVMPSGGFWGGVGEPTIAVAAPAVLNAIFNATGKRIRHLPLKDADLKA
ncbi:MAG: xanthine dehydrogenase family protein molybdopterin-binding subunit [Burkholderiales bacterium]|nr:xanthine dehydrogenase family protein molybdopterin-binding subunit [Burkholderiales bacterium]